MDEKYKKDAVYAPWKRGQRTVKRAAGECVAGTGE